MDQLAVIENGENLVDGLTKLGELSAKGEVPDVIIGIARRLLTEAQLPEEVLLEGSKPIEIAFNLPIEAGTWREELLNKRGTLHAVQRNVSSPEIIEAVENDLSRTLAEFMLRRVLLLADLNTFVSELLAGMENPANEEKIIKILGKLPDDIEWVINRRVKIIDESILSNSGRSLLELAKIAGGLAPELSIIRRVIETYVTKALAQKLNSMQRGTFSAEDTSEVIHKITPFHVHKVKVDLMWKEDLPEKIQEINAFLKNEGFVARAVDVRYQQNQTGRVDDRRPECGPEGVPGVGYPVTIKRYSLELSPISVGIEESLPVQTC